MLKKLRSNAKNLGQKKLKIDLIKENINKSPKIIKKSNFYTHGP